MVETLVVGAGHNKAVLDKLPANCQRLNGRIGQTDLLPGATTTRGAINAGQSSGKNNFSPAPIGSHSQGQNGEILQAKVTQKPAPATIR